MKKAILLLLVVAVLINSFTISSCKSSQSSASKMLKLNLQKGQAYDYDMITDFGQEIMGQEMKMNMNMGYSLNVISDSGNIRTVNTAINRIKMDMQMGPMKFSVDSDKPSSEADTSTMQGKMSLAFSKFGEVIKGKKFLMKVDRDGKVIDVSGFDQILSSLPNSGMDSAERIKAFNSLKEQINGKETSDQFTELFSIFPQKEVKVDDTWEKDFDMIGKFPTKNHTVYKVKDIDGDMVTISSKTKFESPEENMKISGTKNGIVIVDSRSGLVVNADYDYEMTFTAKGFSFTMKGKEKIKGTAR